MHQQLHAHLHAVNHCNSGCSIDEALKLCRLSEKIKYNRRKGRFPNLSFPFCLCTIPIPHLLLPTFRLPLYTLYTQYSRGSCNCLVTYSGLDANNSNNNRKNVTGRKKKNATESSTLTYCAARGRQTFIQ